VSNADEQIIPCQDCRHTTTRLPNWDDLTCRLCEHNPRRNERGIIPYSKPDRFKKLIKR